MQWRRRSALPTSRNSLDAFRGFRSKSQHLCVRISTILWRPRKVAWFRNPNPKTNFSLYIYFSIFNNSLTSPTIAKITQSRPTAHWRCGRSQSEHGSCPPRVYIHVPTILTEKGLCVTHCLCVQVNTRPGGPGRRVTSCLGRPITFRVNTGRRVLPQNWLSGSEASYLPGADSDSLPTDSSGKLETIRAAQREGRPGPHHRRRAAAPMVRPPLA
jgi:hypothetical protein